MKLSVQVRRGGFTALVTILLSTIGLASAAAVQDPGSPASTQARTTHGSGQCSLTRIGTQLVRCDDLTGAGADASSWVPSGDDR